MALKKSGVVLVAENYQQYMNQMREINKAHKEAFSGTNFKNYNQASQQFTQSSKKMKQAADDTWQTVQNLRTQFNSAAKEANNASSGISKLGGAFSGATGGIKSLFSGVTGLIGKLGILATVISTVMKIVEFGKASVEVAARNETLAVSLNTMGKEYGYTQQQVDYATASLKEQGITTSAARQSLIKMARANIEWSEASKLAAIAQGAAVVSGMNSSQAFERLVTGVQKMEPELLDELGITLNRTTAYEKFAATLNTNAKNLTQQQKQQAILNEIYEQSAPVLGVYDAAMETAGKQQGSLARHIEEAQASFGALLLPIKAASIEMKTNFWKGLKDLGKGLQTLAPLMKIAVDAFKSFGGAIANFVKDFTLIGNLTGEASVFETMGRGAQTWGRVFVESTALVGSAIEAAKETVKSSGEQINAVFAGMAKSFELLKSGDFSGAAEAFSQSMEDIKNLAGDMGDEFKDNFGEKAKQALEIAREKFPELYTAWDELGSVAEVSLERQQDAIDDTTASLEAMEAQLAQLEAQYDAMKQIESLQKNFNKQMEKLEEDHQKALADEDKKYQKDIANENKKFANDLAKAEKKKNDDLAKAQKSYEKSAAKLQDDARREDAKEQKQHYRDMENERRRFELEQLQATRQFKVQDRRLRSEGDILALMDLREDFKLQQQEAKENFELGQNETQTSFQDERKQRQDDVQARMDELKTELEDRKAEINTAYQDELADLHNSHNEQLVAIQEAHQERLQQLDEQYQERKQQLQDQYQEQLEELGKSLADERDLTEEGMKEIADVLSELFGDEGIGDALIKGWSERTQSEIGQAVKETKNQIETLKEALKNGTPIPTASTPMQQTAASQFAPSYDIPMRQGGVGVVTGPATFSVEPGQREAFMFNPLPSQSSSMDVNMSGGFNITGGESAGKAAVEEALATMTEEFRIAVTKFARRRGGN